MGVALVAAQQRQWWYCCSELAAELAVAVAVIMMVVAVEVVALVAVVVVVVVVVEVCLLGCPASMWQYTSTYFPSPAKVQFCQDPRCYHPENAARSARSEALLQ